MGESGQRRTSRMLLIAARVVCVVQRDPTRLVRLSRKLCALENARLLRTSPNSPEQLSNGRLIFDTLCSALSEPESSVFSSPRFMKLGFRKS